MKLPIYLGISVLGWTMLVGVHVTPLEINGSSGGADEWGIDEWGLMNGG